MVNGLQCQLKLRGILHINKSVCYRVLKIFTEFNLDEIVKSKNRGKMSCFYVQHLTKSISYEILKQVQGWQIRTFYETINLICHRIGGN